MHTSQVQSPLTRGGWDFTAALSDATVPPRLLAIRRRLSDEDSEPPRGRPGPLMPSASFRRSLISSCTMLPYESFCCCFFVDEAVLALPVPFSHASNPGGFAVPAAGDASLCLALPFCGEPVAVVAAVPPPGSNCISHPRGGASSSSEESSIVSKSWSLSSRRCASLWRADDRDVCGPSGLADEVGCGKMKSEE